MFVAAHNPTDRPVIIDDAGRVLGGGDWGVVDTTATAVQAAVDAGLVTLAETLKVDDAHTLAANDAVRAAKDVDARRRQLDALDADAVHALAADVELPEGTKAERVAELARRADVEIPKRGRQPAASAEES